MSLSPLYCRARGCDHPECREAKNAYERHRVRQRAYGRWQPYVDAEPAREHVQWLVSQGVPLDNLRSVYGRIHVLIYGRPSEGIRPNTKLRRESAEALLAVRPTLDMLGPRARVDASGSRRRIQALAALGWTRREQSRRMGASRARCELALSEDTVTVDLARRVRGLYGELSMVRPEGHIADRCRRGAARRGWVPPLAWEDDLLDVPEPELHAELQRRAAVMDDAELRRCWVARREGDPSLLIDAGAREYSRRKRQREKERQAERAAA